MNIPMITKYGMNLAGMWKVENETTTTTVRIQDADRKVEIRIVGRGRFGRYWELKIHRPGRDEIKTIPILDANQFSASEGEWLFKRARAEMYGVVL